jgi:hypothetical protein
VARLLKKWVASSCEMLLLPGDDPRKAGGSSSCCCAEHLTALAGLLQRSIAWGTGHALVLGCCNVMVGQKVMVQQRRSGKGKLARQVSLF